MDHTRKGATRIDHTRKRTVGTCTATASRGCTMSMHVLGRGGGDIPGIGGGGHQYQTRQHQSVGSPCRTPSGRPLPTTTGSTSTTGSPARPCPGAPSSQHVCSGHGQASGVGVPEQRLQHLGQALLASPSLFWQELPEGQALRGDRPSEHWSRERGRKGGRQHGGASRSDRDRARAIHTRNCATFGHPAHTSSRTML
jgi:hypothetical protein